MDAGESWYISARSVPNQGMLWSKGRFEYSWKHNDVRVGNLRDTSWCASYAACHLAPIWRQARFLCARILISWDDWLSGWSATSRIVPRRLKSRYDWPTLSASMPFQPPCKSVFAIVLVYLRYSPSWLRPDTTWFALKNWNLLFYKPLLHA